MLRTVAPPRPCSARWAIAASSSAAFASPCTPATVPLGTDSLPANGAGAATGAGGAARSPERVGLLAGPLRERGGRPPGDLLDQPVGLLRVLHEVAHPVDVPPRELPHRGLQHGDRLLVAHLDERDLPPQRGAAVAHHLRPGERLRAGEPVLLA